MRLVDLLLNRAPTFPNDPKLAVVEFGRIATPQYNCTQLVTDTQQGTHLDKMFHFFDDGRTLDQMPLEKEVSIRAHFKEQPNLTYHAAPSTGLDIPKRSSWQVTAYSSHDLPRFFGSRGNYEKRCTTGSNHELITAGSR
ncbi:MAG TPA: cyclase family protein [Terriglobales bacterium]|nr:cyclase family protein [Terriglobales bacterium]